MRICLVILFLFAHLHLLRSQNDPGQRHIQKLLEGKWHLVATNFPMWLDGKSKDPDFNYTNFRVKNGKLIFDDKVTYSKDGSAKEIKGKDKQRKSGELSFIWKGKGLLSPFKSNWKVIASDSEGRWIAIYSSKTLLNPEGVDILSRNRNLSQKEIRDIISHLDKSYIRAPIHPIK